MAVRCIAHFALLVTTFGTKGEAAACATGPGRGSQEVFDANIFLQLLTESETALEVAPVEEIAMAEIDLLKERGEQEAEIMKKIVEMKENEAHEAGREAKVRGHAAREGGAGSGSAMEMEGREVDEEEEEEARGAFERSTRAVENVTRGRVQSDGLAAPEQATTAGATWMKVADVTTRWGHDSDLYTCEDMGTGPDDVCIPMSNMALDSSTVFRLACYSPQKEGWSHEWGRDIFVRGLTDIHHGFTPRGTIANYDGIECSFSEDFSGSATGRACLANEDDGHTYWQGPTYSWGWGFMHSQLLRHCDGEYCPDFCPARVYIKTATTATPTVTATATVTSTATITATATATRADQSSVVGDPHVVNAAHAKFDIRAEGLHKLVQIPQLIQANSAPDLRVDAEIQHLASNDCSKTFMTSLSIFGRWTEDAVGLMHISQGSDMPNTTLLINTLSPEEFFTQFPLPGVKLGHASVGFKLRDVSFHVGKHFEGRYGKQQAYLNVRITGLKNHKDLGGLLGYDDHADAEKLDVNCKGAEPAAAYQSSSILNERSTPTITDGGSRIEAE